MSIDWLWLIIGIVLAMFVFPLATGWWTSRQSNS